MPPAGKVATLWHTSLASMSYFFDHRLSHNPWGCHPAHHATWRPTQHCHQTQHHQCPSTWKFHGTHRQNLQVHRKSFSTADQRFWPLGNPRLCKLTHPGALTKLISHSKHPTQPTAFTNSLGPEHWSLVFTISNDHEQAAPPHH